MAGTGQMTAKRTAGSEARLPLFPASVSSRRSAAAGGDLGGERTGSFFGFGHDKLCGLRGDLYLLALASEETEGLSEEEDGRVIGRARRGLKLLQHGLDVGVFGRQRGLSCLGTNLGETEPRLCGSLENSALSVSPMPPVPVPVGSPVWAMKPSITR